jgi:methyl-accepting chemotaxis protein PixJ
MSSIYDQSLVALSIVIAIFASYTSLDLAGRLTVDHKKVRWVWLIGGAIAMGLGIWSMHFIAMLAFKLPIPIFYDVWTVLLSTLPAIVASGGALFFASRPILSIRRLVIGGVLMGTGIALMHYIGMAAMQMTATIQYDPLLLILSFVIAIGASVVALWLAFEVRRQTNKTIRLFKISSALVMGFAIAGMHYTGMAAASFRRTRTASTIFVTEPMPSSFTLLAVGIGIATLIVLSFTLLSALVDKRFTDQARLLKLQEMEALRSQIFTEITLRIRRSLNIEDVLNTAVQEIRQVFNLDRVIIYRFNEDASGTIIAESLTEGWMTILEKTVFDPFHKDYLNMYRSGGVQSVNNIYEANFPDYHRDVLESFQVMASVIVPIVIGDRLLGLLCGHQCSNFRVWQKLEIDLFRQIGIQVSIALEQANLLHELEQAQEVLRLRDRAIAAATNAIVITDPRQTEHPIIFCNPAFETITGYSPQEVIGRNCRFLQGSDTDAETVKQIRNAVKQDKDCQVIIKNYRKDGTPFWNQLSISPVRDTTGQVINFIGVQADITARMQIEEEIRCTKENLQRQVVELLKDVQEASHGNLTVRAEMTMGEIGVVADFFNLIIESLRGIVLSVKQAAQQVNICVGENSGAIRHLADEALKQAEEITHTLESLDSMAHSIQTVANSAHQAANMARNASTTAEAGKTAIEHTVSSILNLRLKIAETAKKVKRLGESSQEISKVVSLINQIALQTNVLSINTSIEAAKAGKEGRAFAVVAEEVTQLAAKSAQATKDIEQIVDNIQHETREVVKAVEEGMTQVVEGTDLVTEAKLRLEQILEVSCQIDELVQSISDATVSQAQTSQGVACLMKQIAQGVLRTSNFSHQISNSLQQTVELTQELQASVGVFKTE